MGNSLSDSEQILKSIEEHDKLITKIDLHYNTCRYKIEKLKRSDISCTCKSGKTCELHDTEQVYKQECFELERLREKVIRRRQIYCAINLRS